MKRVSMWIMLCWICFAGILEAQQAAFRLDVSVENVSLEQFVRQLERETGYSFLTSSSCHPKIFVKEFSYFLMPCHQHCLGVNLLVQR